MKSGNFTIHAKRLWCDGTFLKDKVVRVTDGVIADISDGVSGDFEADILTPGIIDNHIHGGDGFSVNHATADEFLVWLERLAECGVCGIAASPYGTIKDIRASLSVMKEVMERQKNGEGGAKLLGAHIEGPFISPNRPGSFGEDSIIEPSFEGLMSIISGYEDIILEMTLAPELEGCDELIGILVERGIRVLAGHTDSTYDEAVRAFGSGVGATTHTFNTCRPINHREPGIITAALEDDRIYCEMICDLAHLHPAIIKLLYRNKGEGRLMVISDGVTTTNLPDGEYIDCGARVTVRNGESRLTDGGNLNGGGCYVSVSAGKLYRIGIPEESIPYLTALTPADWLGVGNRIAVGREAFMTGFGEGYSSPFVVIGERVYGR